MRKRGKSEAKPNSENPRLGLRLFVENSPERSAQFREQLRELLRTGAEVPPAARVFLCHSHRDKRFVRRLSEDLEALGVSVWMDEWQLEVGDSLHRCIGEGLEKSDFVGIVLSPDSLSSAWCRDELDQALIREKRDGSKIVLPLLYRRVGLPPFLEGRLYLDFSSSYLTALARLAATLHRIPPRSVTAQLKGKKLRSVMDVKAIVDQLLPLSDRVRVLPQETYSAVGHILAGSGVQIGRDRFGLVTGQPPTQIVCLDEYFVDNPDARALSGKTLEDHIKCEQLDPADDEDPAADP